MRIDLAGFGPGSAQKTTQQVMTALGEADLIITSSRLADALWGGADTDSGSLIDASVPYWNVMQDEDRFGLSSGLRILIETDSGKILRILENEPFERAVCLFGGDTSFYSGAVPLLALIRKSRALEEKKARVRVLPGVSSLSETCARLGVPFSQVEVFSAHGRDVDPVRAVMNGKKSFFLTGGENDPAALCARLTRAGLGDLEVTILERLSLGGERIRSMSAKEAAGLKTDPLSVLLVESAPVSEELRRGIPGIPDESFVRGRVPMTKRLVRVCALSLLNPSKEDLCWDLGAGTGSMSIELSARCRRVVSVERNPEALLLMEENRKKFGAWNMEIVEGVIPQILPELPAPDRIFVGGGGGWIRRILGQLKEQHVPVCAPAVTLETLQEARCALEENGYETQVVQVAVTDVIKRGEHHMMDAQNPVFLIAGYPAQRIPEEDMPAAEDRSAAGQTALWNAEKE